MNDDEKHTRAKKNKKKQSAIYIFGSTYAPSCDRRKRRGAGENEGESKRTGVKHAGAERDLI